MIIDKKIMDLVESVFEENTISPILRALLATEIQLYTNDLIEQLNKGQELPIQDVMVSPANEYPCYACQGGGCPVCSGFGTIPQD